MFVRGGVESDQWRTQRNEDRRNQRRKDKRDKSKMKVDTEGYGKRSRDDK